MPSVIGLTKEFNKWNVPE
jgi:vacuolar protein sorting-associated protein 45